MSFLIDPLTPDDDVQLMLAKPRGSHWAAFEKHHLTIQPGCIVCGRWSGQTQIAVHHKYPFSFIKELGREDLECDERNCFTMCDDHHLLVGHLGYFGSFNPRLEYFAMLCRGLTIPQIRALPELLDAARTRPIPIAKMNDPMRAGVLADLNRFLPRKAA